MAKLWVDDIRKAPDGYIWCHSVFRAMKEIEINESRIKDGYNEEPIQLIDLDHDSGNYFQYGGDYIELLKWMEKTGRNYPIKIHSMNPVGVQNMRAIIEKNGWIEIR